MSLHSKPIFLVSNKTFLPLCTFCNIRISFADNYETHYWEWLPFPEANILSLSGRPLFLQVRDILT